MNPAIAVEWGLRGTLPAVIVSAMLVLPCVRDHGLEQRLWRSALVFACVVPLVTIAAATLRALIAPRDLDAAALTAVADAMRTGPDTTNAGIATPRMTLAVGAMLAWAVGTTVLLLRLCIGCIGAWRLLRGSAPAPAHMTTAPRVRICGALTSPATIGSTVLLPADFDDWTEANRSAALAHELSHASQRDFWWQLLSRMYAAIFWWNPASWVLASRLRWLAERISDAAALRVMPDRGEYAALLLDVAQRAPAVSRSHASAQRVAMASRAMLARRIEAVMGAAEATRLSGLRRFAALAAPALGAAAMAIAPMPGAELTSVTQRSTAPLARAETAAAIRDSVTIRLYAAPDSSDGVTHSTARIRWLSWQGLEMAQGETPAAFTMPVSVPFVVMICPARRDVPILVEFRFGNGMSGTHTTRQCVQVFRDRARTGSRGVEYPSGDLRPRTQPH